MSIYEFDDFRALVRAQLGASGEGRGVYAKMAKKLGIHSTNLSQILSGGKPLSMEQAARMTDYLGLTDHESEYFLCLVQYDRAGDGILKSKLSKQLKRLRGQRNDLSLALPHDQRLTKEQQMVFYSSWLYSAIRVLSSIPEFQSAEAIAQRLNLSRRELMERLKFLISTGLCEEKNGNISPGPSYTHLEASSPLISKHHSNWRVCAMQKHAHLKPSDLAYSSLMSISKKDALEIQARIGEMIKKINVIRGKSDCEELRMIGVDWIEM